MRKTLSDVGPELVSEWLQRNLPLLPDSVTYGSNKLVWWKGKCGYEWKATVKNRVVDITNGTKHMDDCRGGFTADFSSKTIKVYKGTW